VASFFVSLLVLTPIMLTIKPQKSASSNSNTHTNTFFPTATATPFPLPERYVIPQQKHMFQTFNNCGPATLSMALSYYGIDILQAELGEKLRPYQVPGEDNDDKSVTLHEVAAESKNYNLIPYLRPNGDIEKLKKFISLNLTSYCTYVANTS